MATIDDVKVIIDETADKYQNLVRQGSNTAAMEELLLRIIWHLNQKGITAGRQQNPSGAISKDKLAVLVEDYFHAFDILSDSDRPGAPLDVHMNEVSPVHYIAESGVPDDEEWNPSGPEGPNEPPAPQRISYDEAKSVEFGLACNKVYEESRARFDPGMIAVHASRAAWDYYVGGLSWEESKRKHVNEFRAEYALPPL